MPIEKSSPYPRYNGLVKLVLYISLFIYSFLTFSKVDPPNYNFSVDQFKPYLPGQNIQDLVTKLKPKIMAQDKEFTTYKFEIEHIRYKFALLVQANKFIVTDFHARLPQYFLHDVFHQSLINRYGKQTKYKKSEESALYLWKNIKNISHLYSGTCTITCFPIFYAAYTEKHEFGKKYKRLIDKLVETEY